MSGDFVSQAIVINTINYSESGVIIKFFTRENGLVSVFAPKKKGNKKNSFQALSIVEIEYMSRKKASLYRLKSSKIIAPFNSIYNDPLKTMMLLFLSEVLVKTVKDEAANPELYNFLRRELLFFDQLEEGVHNFHLYFLSHLITHLGFRPLQGEGKFFNIEEGEFVEFEPREKYFNEPESKMFLSLLQSSGDDLKSICVDRTSRINLLKGIVGFYRYHCPGFGELKSLEVLEEVYV
ncbi:MAG: DNA repair protein RecO [Bacteroidetes bacterium]|nr:DNA repair protein RecO [Bacteroidota bacterium]